MTASENRASRQTVNTRLFAYEDGELDEEEVIQLFQDLLDTGMIHVLQGSHKRTAEAFLEAGLITYHPDEE